MKRFSVFRVILLLLIFLNLMLFSLMAAYMWVPGAQPILSTSYHNLKSYLLPGSDAVDDSTVFDKIKGPRIVSQEGSAITAPAVDFYFEGTIYQIKPLIDSAAYKGAVNADRLVYSVEDVSDRIVLSNYYRAYVEQEEQRSSLDSVIKQLRGIKEDKKLDSDRYVELIAKYVQSIPYDTSRAALINDPEAKPGKGDPRFPIQVLGDGKGDCDEKVFLLAAILGEEGYKTAALIFENERHMSLGIKSEGSGFRDTGYEYVETTGIGYVSELPDQLAGGVVLASQPQVVALTAGERGYSIKSVNEVQRIISERKRAASVLSELDAKMKGLKNNPEEYNRYVAQYNTAVEAHNTLNNLSGGKNSDELRASFKDRRLAIDWLNKNSF